MDPLSIINPANTVLNRTVTSARRLIAGTVAGHYNEDHVQENVLNRLDQIYRDTRTLRHTDLYTALQLWRDWENFKQEDCDDLVSDREAQLKKLENAMEKSRMAFNNVPDPLHKIQAARILILASYDYHFWLTRPMPPPTATTEPTRTEPTTKTTKSTIDQMQSEEEFRAMLRGKKEAQRLLLRQMQDLPELASAANEELGHDSMEGGGSTLVRRLLPVGSKVKRTKILGAFRELYAIVFDLAPRGINMRYQFPQLEVLKDAAVQCFRKNLQVPLAHFLTEPKHRKTLRAAEHVSSSPVSCCAVLADRERALVGRKNASLQLIHLHGKSGSRCTILEFKGHKGSISCCVPFCEESRMVSASDDETLKIWDLENNGKELQTLGGHGAAVSCCVVYHKERRILSGCKDGRLFVWDIRSLDRCTILAILGGEGRRAGPCSILCCGVYGNNTRALTGGDGVVRVWDLKHFREIRSTPPANACEVQRILVCEKQNLAISAGCRDDILKWKLSDSPSPSERHSINELAWEPQLRSTAPAASFSSSPTAENLQLMTRRQKRVSCCTVSPDDQSWILSVSSLGSFVLRDFVTGEPLCARYISKRVGITCCAAISNTMVLMGHSNGDVKILELPILCPSLVSSLASDMKRRNFADGRSGSGFGSSSGLSSGTGSGRSWEEEGMTRSNRRNDDRLPEDRAVMT